MKRTEKKDIEKGTNYKFAQAGKAVITLSILALIASTYGQVTKKQTEKNTNLVDTFSIINNIVDTNNEVFEEQNTSKSQLFDIRKIDSTTYFTLKKNTKIQKTELEKITDLKHVKKLLKGRVIWGKIDEEMNKLLEDEQEEGDIVYKIVFRNGKTISYDYPEAFFIFYFPQEDILFLEGGHTSDVTFNLTTGEDRTVVGNPDYTIYSPSKKYRLNMYDNGQMPIYFVQEKSETKYNTVIQLSWETLLEKDIEYLYLLDAFWQNDTILNFIVSRYLYSEDKSFYYQLILK